MFDSNASNLSPDDDNGRTDVYARDLQTLYDAPPTIAADEDGEGPRTPSMSRARIVHDLDELLDAASMLIEDRLPYEQALEQHFARLLRIIDRSRIWTFEELHRAYV